MPGGIEKSPQQREKNRVTVVSLVAAVLLTSAKLVVGLLTGSLGLLAEAAHSALDTVASGITFFSVRVAGRPADENHPYGHARVENLSAVTQGVLLIGTAAWISYEAVRRMFFASVEVEPTVWAFAVMGASILVDLWRSRMLSRAARRYDSRALEADALNFRADMFSSVVVIAGLALVVLGERLGDTPFLLRADAAAALVVGVFIFVKSGALAARSVNVLLDRAPVGLQERISRRARSVPGVVGVPEVRLRESGDRKFADIVIPVSRAASAAEGHEISERVERAVREEDASIESVVHVEPVPTEAETMAEAVRAAALGMGFRTHHERVRRFGESFEASLHVEVDAGLTLGEAHDRARELGDALRVQEPRLSRVSTHIEVAEPDEGEWREPDPGHGELEEEIRRAVSEADAGARCHEVRLYHSEHGLDAILHCDFPGSTNIGKVHACTERIERGLHARFPSLGQIVIHAEPRETPREGSDGFPDGA
jgi:cation diffusion facilitator family transporter